MDLPTSELLDLFRSESRSAATTQRTRINRVTEPAVHEPIAALVDREGFRSDTLLVAAWLLLQHRWRGIRHLRLFESCSSDLGLALLHFGSYHVSGHEPVIEWLRHVDTCRQSLLPKGEDDVPMSFAGAWIRDGAAIPGGPADLALAVGWSEQPVPTLFVEFDGSSVDAGQAAMVLACLSQTAHQLATRTDVTLNEIDTLGSPLRQSLLTEWKSPAGPHDPALTVHGIFARQAASRGDAPALAYRDARVSYKELDALSDRMAARIAAGVPHGSTVCVALERGPEAIASILAVLKAGAAYLPVDLAHPQGRLAFMLADADVALIITTSARRASFPAHIPVLLTDSRIEEIPAAQPPAAAATNGQSLAYVMYTSGSTGTPKGIEVCHQSIIRLVVNAGYVDLSPSQVLLHAAPLGFDASTLEIWGALLNGGCCALHDEDLPTPQGLARTIRGAGVTTAWLTAALFNAIVDDDPLYLRELKQLLIGGEALSVSHVRRFLRDVPDVTLINGYGPTECTTFTTTYTIPPVLPAEMPSIPIGRPIGETQLYVLGPSRELLPPGFVGELYVGGRGLARGYLKRPELTAERFVSNPFGTSHDRLYRTGDLVRYLADGNLEFIGRVDSQVKIRGFRIELGEIESALGSHPAVKACAVTALNNPAGHARLVAYAVASDVEAPAAAIRAHLASRLPDFMIPTAYVWLAALPITANGKLDRHALPAPPSARPDLAQPYAAPTSDAERRLCAAFATTLGIDRAGRFDNFFDLGGNSLMVLRTLAQLAREGTRGLTTTAFFRQPTPEALARALTGTSTEAIDPRRQSRRPLAAPAGEQEPIAIIGMAGRFPGARTIEAFWDNLCQGKDSITTFRDQELDPGISESLRSDPLYVKRRGVIDDVEMFDAGFFGITPREAELMDPQHRVFLELCWECLERGGHAPDRAAGPVGVFAGMYNATYFQRHLVHRPDLVEKLGEFQVMLNNEKDYIATRIAYRLNLTGPAISIHTACSTSLVAIAQAFAALRAGQCDMALAGGVSVTCPPRSGYLYQEGAMLSPDGHTRSFAADAQGTVFSDGAAVVLLKRVSDALADGDAIYAVIRSVSVNNDGRDKASFTAPGVDGQAAVIAAAHDAAGIGARDVSYIEAHGTATPLGDPVEVEALTRAFRRTTPEVGFCRLGSVKSNVGHLVIAAGAAGVIKTALALTHHMLPPTIHFDRPNPKIAFHDGPFVVNSATTHWPRTGQPRLAGVSSFGVGGTNAHVVLEEAPRREPSSAADGPQLLQLSARTPAALTAMAEKLAGHLSAAEEVNLADVAYTLDAGRSRFQHRLAVVADTPAAAAAALRTADHPLRATRPLGAAVPELVWVFPGQGAQYAGMGRGLYAHDEVFRNAFDECTAALATVIEFDIKERMFEGAPESLAATSTTQPAIFCLEYALARTWLARGIQPTALIGHSVGEFAAAVIAGVMTLADAARLVARRASLMQAQPPGSMLSVRRAAGHIESSLRSALSLAADNGPNACVVAGPSWAIDAYREQLESDGVPARLLQTSHAFHSSMMEGAVAPFEEEVRAAHFQTPNIPIVSTLTGSWLTDAQAIDPSYWARHLREPVRFSPAVRAALARGQAAFLEIGPRGSLSALVRQHVSHGGPAPVAVPSLSDCPGSELPQMLLAQGHLWTLGVEASKSPACPSHGRRRIVLPTYPFERTRHWVDAVAQPARDIHATAVASAPLAVAVAALPVPLPASITMTTSSPASPDSRVPQLVSRLKSLFEDVAGLDLAGADPSMSFVELGFDSLTLTQAALQVKKQFKAAITFRQLMEQYRSFDSLAGFLDATLPIEKDMAIASASAAAASTTAADTTPPGQPAPAVPMTAMAPVPFSPGTPLVQQVIQQQMQLMAQQLALLSGATATAMPVSSPASPAAGIPAGTVSPSAPAAPGSVPAAASGDNGGPIRYDVKKAFGAIARIHTQASALTDRQRARLDAFTRRYTERTAKSKAYTASNRPHLADPRVVNGFRPMTKEITYQVVIERSKGSRMWDLDGNEYVDVLNGFGMNLFGWQPDFINEAVRKQLDEGYDIGPQHPLAGEVARLVCELTGFDRAGLCNTGSEAVMAAVRIARTVTGRSTIVLFTGSYHGTFDEVVVRAGRGGKGIPGAPGIMPDVYGDVRVLDYGTPESLEFIRQNADDLAAVLVEPVQSRRPDFQPREFLKEVRSITEKSGTCLIFDEVITGFRSHLGGAQALFGIRADLASYGKVIGGGFPVGVIAGKREFMDALDGGAWHYGDDSIPTVGVTYFAGTFVRHPLALAAAKAALEHLKEHGPRLQSLLTQQTTAMAEELSAFCREVGAPIEIRHFASLWRVSWREEHPLQDLLFAMMRSRGIHILDNFPCFMTTAHTEQDVALIKNAFKESVAELQEAEFLPRRREATVIADASRPPTADAKLGRDKDGKPAWFVPDTARPGKYRKYKSAGATSIN